MPPVLLDRLKRILAFAGKVAEEIVGEETEILEKTIPRMFEVMQKVARFSCDYVKRGRFGRESPFLGWQVLMIAERTVGGLVRPEKMEEMDEELTRVIEDFDRAVNVEALRLAKETGKTALSRIGDSPSSVVSYRARDFAWEARWEARICQDGLRSEPPLHGRHPEIYPTCCHGLGSQSTGRKSYTTEKSLLVLRLTWNRENIVSSFDL